MLLGREELIENYRHLAELASLNRSQWQGTEGADRFAEQIGIIPVLNNLIDSVDTAVLIIPRASEEDCDRYAALLVVLSKKFAAYTQMLKKIITELGEIK